MIDGKFDVVFRGQVVKNQDLETVKANLVKLFKSSPEAIEKLFSGNEVAIRKGLDYTAAMKYQSALKSAGALALIKEVEEPKETAAPRATNEGKASFGAKDDVSEVTQSDQNSTADDKTTNDDISAHDSISEESSETDAIGENAENIRQDAESSDGEMSIAAVGAQILPPKIYEKREVDTSSMSLANAGERILPEKEPVKVDKPNIDHLSLE